MDNNLVRFFHEEIEGWKQQIEGIYDEADLLEKKLEAVVRQNTISGIAAATEAHQSLLDRQTNTLEALIEEINRQDILLTTLIQPAENKGLPKPLRNKQDQLRKKMRQTEKDYLEVKFSCHDFVSNMLK